MGAIAAPALGACTLSLPMTSLLGEPELTTGSIAADGDAVTMSLRREEWEAAGPALADALDPARKGQPASWNDAMAGISVAFRPQGEAFVRNDQVCRTFTAEISQQGAASTHLGTACRIGAGSWTVQKLKPWTGRA